MDDLLGKLEQQRMAARMDRLMAPPSFKVILLDFIDNCVLAYQDVQGRAFGAAYAAHLEGVAKRSPTDVPEDIVKHMPNTPNPAYEARLREKVDRQIAQDPGL